MRITAFMVMKFLCIQYIVCLWFAALDKKIFFNTSLVVHSFDNVHQPEVRSRAQPLLLAIVYGSIAYLRSGKPLLHPLCDKTWRFCPG